MSLPVNAQGLLVRSSLLDAGHSPAEINARVRAGDWLPVARGIYLPEAALSEEERTVAWRRRAAVYRYRCLAQAAGGPVLSHQSAAAVLRLELLRPDLTRIHVLSGRPTGGKIQRRRHIHVGDAGGTEVEVDGVVLTGPARTAVDVAAAGTFAQALAVFDAALARGVTREELAEVLEQRRRPGHARTRLALQHADGLSANPGESWGRAQIIEAGLPVPRIQVHYVLPDGSDAYTDYDWEGRLVGEFDGVEKYTRLRRPGESVADVVLREKRREDGLRALGLDVTRAIIADFEHDRWVPRVHGRLERLGLLR